MQPGLNDSTSVGRCGRLNEFAGNDAIALNTCVAHGLKLFTYGSTPQPIGAPSTAGEYSVKILHSSWTGRTIELTTRDERQIIDLRHSLPGPMFTIEGKRWGFDWGLESTIIELQPLPDGQAINAWKTIANPPQVMLATGKGPSVLVVTSQPAESLEIITHEHWWFTFAEPGARVMLVPLLDDADIPDSAEAVQLWLDLIAIPPVRAAESFDIAMDDPHAPGLTIETSFTDAGGSPTLLAPLPNLPALWGQRGGLQELPAHTQMLTTPLGPYAVSRGASHTRTVRMDWIKSAVVPTRDIEGELSPMPLELAYPGDATWNEKEPMDTFISLRLWAPHREHLPAELWDEVKSRVRIPTAEQFDASLMTLTELANGRTWSKDAALFAHVGVCSYDTDWYNGLTLSGLHRACVCGDDEISVPARKLAGEIKTQRAKMLAYHEIYHDFSLSNSWVDPRGINWDTDCSHNGLEGVLAEARLRDMEGDTEGADFALYLAGKMAVSFIATLELAKHCVRLGFATGRTETATVDNVFGVRGFSETSGAHCATSAMKNPCIVTPDFPEYCGLLKKYAPREHFERLVAAYEADHPLRYDDWLKFYVGDIADEIRTGADKVGENQGHTQERRVEAAVFYHVAQDVAIRLWLLDEPGDEIEARFAHPLPLSVQIHCRADTHLSV